MDKTDDVKINLFDLAFLIEKVSLYLRGLKDKDYSMKLWEDRIKKIKLKCKFDELIRNKFPERYEYELGYIKEILINIYQNHTKITFSKALDLIKKEIGVPLTFLPVKVDIYSITSKMLRRGEILGKIDDNKNTFEFKGIRNIKR
ncbi:MAG: hypothetical protein ACTSVV_14750 [Promethearchaeota archaeon]